MISYIKGKPISGLPEYNVLVEETYSPLPLNINKIILSDEGLHLAESLAEEMHEEWAYQQERKGWRFGVMQDNEHLQSPLMRPYDNLTEEEKKLFFTDAVKIIKIITKLGYKITQDENKCITKEV